MPGIQQEIGRGPWETWQTDPTPEHMSAVLKDLDPVIVSEAQRYPGPKSILYWQGKQLTRDAVKSYDPTRGTTLRTWVTTQLKPLNRYGQRLSPVRIPEAVRRNAAELHSVTEKMHDELGRLPTDVELADETGLSVTKLQKLRSRVGVSMSDSQMVDQEGNPQTPAVIMPKVTDFASDAVYGDLDPQEQLIYDWKTGSHGRDRIANKEIAVRLKVSPAYVTQLSQKIAQRIQEVSGYAL